MQFKLAALALLLLLVLIIVRVLWLRRLGIRVVHFGRLDRSDFLIPPFALFYFYTIFAAAFGLPLPSDRRFFQSDVVAWVGAIGCYAGLLVIVWSLHSFGRGLRVGIDVEQPDELITTGIFAHSRNPIYTGFGLVLLGQFLIFPNWVPLVYLIAGLWLLHRQVVREETFLRQHYGAEYEAYCRRVRRYV